MGESAAFTGRAHERATVAKRVLSVSNASTPRAEIGIHHHVAGPYLAAYAREMAWRENNRRISNGEQYLMAADAALQHPVSRQWKGYWQRSETQVAK